MNDQTHITLIYLCTQIPENYKLPFRISFLQPYRLCYDMASDIRHRICVKHHLKPFANPSVICHKGTLKSKSATMISVFSLASSTSSIFICISFYFLPFKSHVGREEVIRGHSGRRCKVMWLITSFLPSKAWNTCNLLYMQSGNFRHLILTCQHTGAKTLHTL